MQRVVVLLLAPALALALAGCSSGSPTPKPTGIRGLQTFTEEPKVRHVKGHVGYDHTPPAGGQHFGAWLRCAVYDQPVPNEFAVHSEEHGAVWLTYLPGEDPARLVALYASRQDYVLVSPYPGQPGKFMASTWGAQLSVDAADDPRLAAFVKAYAGGGQGGEKGADCAHGLTPAQARTLFDKATS
jgi:hypothetical protein